MSKLLEPVQLGELSLPNRILMAPLTRCRASPGRVPNDLMREYYVQRASAGLIISEATSVAPMGVGYPDTPGIWSKEQIEGWAEIVRAVHAAGGRMMLQLWHVGRVSHPIYLDGALPVGPSAIAVEGHVRLLRPQEPYPLPRALALDEIAGVVQAYAQGAENARLAGFDGVEIHGANGYLLDQFLQDGANKRRDRYGGGIENRARLLLEVTDAVIGVWGAGRVGMHLAPRGDASSMGDSNPAATFGYVAQALGDRKIAFLCVREHPGPGALGLQLKKQFGGAYVVNEGFTPEMAEAAIESGEADAAAFGKVYIANPDLVERIRRGGPLNEADPATFYAKGAHG